MIKDNISLVFENMRFPACKLSYSYFEFISQNDTKVGWLTLGQDKVSEWSGLYVFSEFETIIIKPKVLIQ